MMKSIKSLLVLALASLMAVSCFKDPVKTPTEFVEFDPAVFAKELNKSYSDFYNKYNQYVTYADNYSGMIILASKVEIEGQEYQMNLFAIRDNYESLDKIIVQPVSNDNAEFFWDYYTLNADKLGFGQFINAKYYTNEAKGYCSSLEQTRSLVSLTGVGKIITAPAFDYVPGEVTLLTMLEGSYFGLILQDNWFTADYDVMYRWLGAQFSGLCSAYFTIGIEDDTNKTMLFDSSKDLLGNRFQVLVESTSDNIDSITATLDESALNSWSDVLGVFQNYAMGKKELLLGIFSKAYYKLGDSETNLGTGAEAASYLAANGRPSEGEVIVVFNKETTVITISMSADRMTVNLRAKKA